MTIRTEAELAETILDDIRHGDQGWRADIAERYADHLESRSVQHQEMLVRLEAMATPTQPVPAMLAETIRNEAANLKATACALRRGFAPGFDQENAELILRCIPVVAMLAPDPPRG